MEILIKIIKFIFLIIMSIVSTFGIWKLWLKDWIRKSIDSSCGTGSIGEGIFKSVIYGGVVFIIMSVLFYIILFILF